MYDSESWFQKPNEEKAVEGFASDYKDKITKDVAPITYEN